MADKLEREYVVPLRKEWLKVQSFRRAGRAAKAIKKFIAKHMKVPDRDVNNVKLDVYLNSEMWFRGKSKPPAKVKVKAIKEGDIVRVELAEMPEAVKFRKAKHEKYHREAEKKATPKAEEKKEESKPEESEEKKEEDKEAKKEKDKSVEESQAKQAKAKNIESKHVPKTKETPINRKALSRH